MNYIELLKKTVKNHENKVALVDQLGNRKTTFKELDEISGLVSGKIHALNIKKQSFIMISCGRNTEYVSAFLGILKAGCIVVPINNEYPKDRIDFINNDANCALIIDETFFKDLNEYAPYEDLGLEDDKSILLYTSGSTGTPKGILYTVHDIDFCMSRKAALNMFNENDIQANLAHFTFTVIMEDLFFHLLNGSTVHILADEVRKNAELISNYYDEHNITCGYLPPTVLKIFKSKSNSLKTILTGSERVSNTFLENICLTNNYGMSETMGAVLCFKIDKKYDNTPIGKPEKGVTVKILDSELKDVKKGEYGEICVIGDFRTTYFKDEKRTQETFIKLDEHKVMVRTGDIGYFDEDGNVVYVNRKDWMVKINGQRVETLEIESLMNEINDINSSIVKSFQDNNNQTYLVGYYVSKTNINEKNIIKVLKDKLPDYMIPRYFVRLDNIPKNINGKLDRTKLLPPTMDMFKEDYVKPRNSLEEKLCKSFEKVLNINNIGINDDFIKLGGDSINVMKLIIESKIENLTQNIILKYRTPKLICENLNNNFVKIKQNEEYKDIYKITSAQKGIYLECINNPELLEYNIPFYLALPKNINIDKFKKSIINVVNNHRIFKTNIKVIDGEVCLVYKDRDIIIEEKNVKSFVSEHKKFVRSFNLEHDNLYRFEIINNGSSYEFLFDIHHIIFDGSSVRVFINEIIDNYLDNKLYKEELNMFDLSLYEDKIKESKEYKEAIEFFDKKLSNINVDSLFINDVISEKEKDEDYVLKLTSSNDLISRISNYCKINGITENTFILGAFAYTLAKFNGTNESLFLTVNNGRHDTRLNNSIGMYVKNLPLYFKFNEEDKIIDYLKDTQDYLFESIQNDCISYDEIVNRYNLNTNMIMFVYQSDLFDKICLKDDYITLNPISDNKVNNPVIMVLKDNNELLLELKYDNSKYTKELINDFGNMFINVINEMLIEVNLKNVSFINKESKKIIDFYNSTNIEIDNKTVIDKFKEQVKNNPNNKALVYLDNEYTYKELDIITDNLAKYLLELGIKNNSIVGVLVNRNEYMTICSLAITKAGCAYLPLDPTYPKERINFMINDTKSKIVISDDDLVDILENKYNIIKTSSILKLDDNNYELPKIAEDNLFVILYTSGSTGEPKGALLVQKNIMSLVKWGIKYFELTSKSKYATYASYGFDANMFDTYATLSSGGELHIIPENMRLDLLEVANYFNKNEITNTTMTTQVGREFTLVNKFKSLKYVLVGGEKLIPFEPPKGIKFINGYGPAECTMGVSFFEVDKKYTDIPIGKANDNTKLYVVDNYGRLLPRNAIGELYISGKQVSLGYLNREEKTKEVYTQNKFDNVKGYETVYHTGDLVRYIYDGNLEFIGRRDSQVKIRGFRIELSEIEEVIRSFIDIKDATVIDVREEGKETYIAAYIVSNKKIDINELNKFILEKKPSYMLPSVIMQIDRIPLTQNHKVDKKSLPKPQRNIEDIIKPRDDIEQKIFDIVSNVIGNKEFGINTNIYEAGLTSMGNIRLNIDLANEFNKSIKISDIKENPTIIDLKKFLEKDLEEEKITIQEEYPLTNIQEGIFVECMDKINTTKYNMTTVFELDEKIDLRKLSHAIKETINAHPFLKAIIKVDDDGNPKFVRNDSLEPVVEGVIVKEFNKDEVRKPFKLIGGKLYRIDIIKTDTKNYLLLDFHHIICDGTSQNIIIRDINNAYLGNTLEKEKYTSYEHCLEVADTDNSKEYNEAKEYYHKIFDGCDTNYLPLRNKKSNTVLCDTLFVKQKIDINLIKKYCDDNKISLNAFFNAVFGFVLGKYNNKEDALYSSIYNGRNSTKIYDSVGMFVKTFPILCNLNGETNIIDYTKNIEKQLINSIKYDAYPFSDISREFGINMDVLFIYQGDIFTNKTIGSDKTKTVLLNAKDPKNPLTINVFVEKDGLYYYSEYRSDMYSKEFIKNMFNIINNCALEFINKTKLKEVSLLNKEYNKFLDRVNDTKEEFNNKPIYELFYNAVKDNKDKIAVICNKEKLTFEELNILSNRIGNKLVKLGVKNNDIIGLILDRSKEVIIGELGILKSGGSFLPIVPNYPNDRIEYSLIDSSSKFVITSKDIRDSKKELFASKPYKVLLIEDLLNESCDSDLNVKVNSSDLAYTIYTSGSTGKPKGVMIEQHNLANYANLTKKHLAVYSFIHDINAVLAIASISFDMSVFEIFPPLCNGKTVCMATEDEIHNPIKLMDLINENNVESMVCTPSFLSNIVDEEVLKDKLKHIRTFVVGGESFQEGLYNKLKSINKNCRIINGYGPTETTMCTSGSEITSTNNITIGPPAINTKYYVVDKYNNILPPYLSGELIIAGECVGRGYINLEEKNKQSFFKINGEQAYHSGDCVRYNLNGEIEFSGRIDNQVKVRGFRIELDEIEKIINSFKNILSSKVLVESDTLIGFFTSNETINIEELKKYIKTKLTYYMVPSIIMQINEMPLTSSGKIDKAKLLENVRTTKKEKNIKVDDSVLINKICNIMAGAIGISSIGVNDNFFEMGGTSLTATKVALKCLNEKINIEYQDIFDYPTPSELINAIKASNPDSFIKEGNNKSIYDEVLKYNNLSYIDEIKKENIGDVLLTGATGFLGSHILRELLIKEKGKVYCLVKNKNGKNGFERLKEIIDFYFENTLDNYIHRVVVINGDITDDNLENILNKYNFNTIINSAACVKHFASDDILDRINVNGVRNLIKIAKNKKVRLVQISTSSVAGASKNGSLPDNLKIKENMLEFGQDLLDNKYIISKYNAEKLMLDAIKEGLDGKIIRVGNLMGRYSDGKFQINYESNAFLNGLKGYATIGACPLSHMMDPMALSPIDYTAASVVLLASTPKIFTIFQAENHNIVDEYKVVKAIDRNGYKVDVLEDSEYKEKFKEILSNDKLSNKLAQLVIYDDKEGIKLIKPDTKFTVLALYKLGFSWPIVDDLYLNRIFKYVKEIGMYN